MRQLMFLVCCVALVAGCSEGQKGKPLSSNSASPQVPDLNPVQSPVAKSLYARLGGEKAIVKVVDDFVANVVADEKIRAVHKKHFMEGDVAGLKKKLVDQVGEATGGPQKYLGKNMRDAHKGLGINNADFDALVADLTKALNDNGAKAADRDELLKMLGGMRGDVVEVKD